VGAEVHNLQRNRSDQVTADLQKTLGLIKKLMAKADSAAQIGSAEEAATFAAKANELLLKHKLEMTDLELASEDTDDPIEDGYINVAQAAGLKKGGGARRAAWIEGLASRLCNAHFCKLLVVPGSKTIRIIGRKSDKQIVEYLLTTLVREGERLAILYERVSRVSAQRAGLPIPQQPKRGFLLGFTAGIGEKLREMRVQVVNQGGQHAIVRFQQATAAVQKYFDDTLGKRVGKASAPNNSTRNGAAFHAGKQAGRSQSLHGGLGQGGSSKSGTIASGSFLLGGGK
jgi:hypothetical protein